MGPTRGANSNGPTPADCHGQSLQATTRLAFPPSPHLSRAHTRPQEPFLTMPSTRVVTSSLHPRRFGSRESFAANPGRPRAGPSKCPHQRRSTTPSALLLRIRQQRKDWTGSLGWPDTLGSVGRLRQYTYLPSLEPARTTSAVSPRNLLPAPPSQTFALAESSTGSAMVLAVGVSFGCGALPH